MLIPKINNKRQLKTMMMKLTLTWPINQRNQSP